MTRLSLGLLRAILLAGAATSYLCSSPATAGMPDERRTDPVPEHLQRARPAVRPPGTIGRQNDVSVSVSHIEVTQAIQDIGHTVPLLAGRTAYVRVFMNIGGNTPSADSAVVAGQLVASIAGGNSFSIDNLYRELEPRILGSQNGNLEAQRSDALSGLVFMIPPERMTPGELRVTLGSIQERDGRRQVACTNCDQVQRVVTVREAAPPIRLNVIGISYVHNGIVHEPRPLDYAMIPSWLMRAYPVSTVVYETRVLPYPVAGHHPPISQRPPPPPQPTDFGCREVNTFLSQVRAADVAGGTDPRTHYYGLVYEGAPGQTQFFMRGCAAIPASPDPSAIGSGPTGASRWGWDDSGSYGGWYTAHELGHTLGRRHVGGTCNEQGTDPGFPFPNGEISGADTSFSGFDPGDAAIEPRLSPLALPGRNIGGRHAHDVMSYCQWQWISHYTYSNMLARLTAENALPSSPAPVAVASEPNPTSVLLSGAPSPGSPSGQPVPVAAGAKRLLHIVVRLEDKWSNGRIVSVTPGVHLSPPAATADVPAIEALTADGRVLARFPAPVQIYDEDGPAHDDPQGAGLINATIAVDEEAAGLRIVYAGRTIAETRRDSTRAMMALSAVPAPTQPRLAPTADRPMLLTWQAQHSGGLQLSYTVQVSADGGASWQTVGVGLTSPQISVPLSSLSAAVRARIGAGQPLKYKVIASDGFNSIELIDDVR